MIGDQRLRDDHHVVWISGVLCEISHAHRAVASRLVDHGRGLIDQLALLHQPLHQPPGAILRAAGCGADDDLDRFVGPP